VAIEFSRVHIEQVNAHKVAVIFDFAFGDYLSTKTFFSKLSEITQGILSTGKVTLDTGQEVDSDTPGGLLAIQLYMDSLDANRQTMSGLSKLGLNVEKQVWKNI
jgi:hypothetical protein